MCKTVSVCLEIKIPMKKKAVALSMGALVEISPLFERKVDSVFCWNVMYKVLCWKVMYTVFC